MGNHRPGTRRWPAASRPAGRRTAGRRQGRFLEALAALLLCDTPRDGTACGECRSCRQHAAGSHPDCTVLSPDPLQRAAFSAYPGQRCQQDGSRKKPASIISVDQVRELRQRLHASAHYGAYKLAILLPADALNTAAANALLKLLEEPPDNTVFLLLSQRSASLPATVRSRCQLLRFSTPPAAAARAVGRPGRPGRRAGAGPGRWRTAARARAAESGHRRGVAGGVRGPGRPDRWRQRPAEPGACVREAAAGGHGGGIVRLAASSTAPGRRATRRRGRASGDAGAFAGVCAGTRPVPAPARASTGQELALQRLLYPLWAGNTTPSSAKPEQS